MAAGDVIIKFNAEDNLTPEIKKQIEQIKKLNESYQELELRLKDLKADKKGILLGVTTSDIDSIRKLQLELTKLKEAYANAERGTKTEAKNAIKKKQIELEAKLTKEITRQTVALKKKELEIKQSGILIDKEVSKRKKLTSATNREKIAIDKATTSRKKENAVRSSTMNSVVRHLRQIETMVVAYYALSRVVNFTATKGIMLNKTIEDAQVGIAALISANTEGGDSAERFGAAMAISASTVMDIKKAAIDTAATFPQLTEVFQQAIGGALGAGQAMGKTTQDVIKNTITLSKQMTNIAASIGMPMDQVREEIRSIMEGTITKDSRIGKMLGMSNADIDDAKKSVGGLFKYLEDKLVDFDELSKEMTMTRAVARLGDAFDTMRMQTTAPLFDDLKLGILDATTYIKNNTDEWVDSFQTSYFQIKGFMDYYGEAFGKVTEAISYISDEVSNLVSITGDALVKLGSLFDVSGKVTTRVEGKGLKELYKELQDAKTDLANKGSFSDVLFGTKSEKSLQDSITILERKIRVLEEHKKVAIESGTEIIESISRQKEGYEGLSNAYKEIFELGNNKFTSVSQINDDFGNLVIKYSQYPEVMEAIGNAATKAVKITQGSNTELKISMKSTIDEMTEFANKALTTLSDNQKLDSLNDKYRPIFEKLQTNIASTNKQVREDAIKTAEIVAQAYEKESNALNKSAVNTKIKNYALMEYNASLKIQKDIEKQAKTYVKNQNSQYATYYDATGQKEKGWALEKASIESEFSMLKPEELSKLVAIYKTDFFDKIEDESTSTWESMQKTMKDNLTSGFEDFFNFTKDGFGDLQALGESVVSAIMSEIVKTQIAQPLASATTSIVGSLANTIFGFANGGIMSSQGAIPLRAYSSGGIADSPQLAIYGEGRMNEAYVPLPDGRTIPVTMQGNSGGGDTYITINNESGVPLDMKETSRKQTDNRTEIKLTVQSLMQTDATFRKMMGA
jgi:hypothetical protein